MPRMSVFARLIAAVSIWPMKFGATMAANSPMITTTTMISSNVKPCSATRRGVLITRITFTWLEPA